MSTNDNPIATPEATAPTSPTTVRRKRQSSGYQPKEWKLVPLRECPTPEQMQLCDTPERAVAYWHSAVVSNPYFDPERECLVVIILNTRRRIRGHHLVATGTMDTILCHPRDVFRIAIVAGAAALVLAHIPLATPVRLRRTSKSLAIYTAPASSCGSRFLTT